MRTATLRFATVRPPEPPDPAASAIPFNPALLQAEPAYQQSLFRELDGIVGDSRRLTPEQTEAVGRAVAAFRSTPAMITTDAAFERLYPGFSRYREWLTSGPRTRVADISRMAERLLGFPPGTGLSAAQLLMLVDSLIAHVILGEQPGLRKKLSAALRIDNIVKKAPDPAVVRGAADLRRLLAAPVLLPRVLAPSANTVRDEVPPPAGGGSDLEERSQHAAALDRITTAYDELLEARNRPLSSEEQRELAVPPGPVAPERAGTDTAAAAPRPGSVMILQPGPASFNVRPEHLEAVSAATRSELKRLRVTADTSFADALQRLERAGQAELRQLARGVFPYRAQVMVGTALLDRHELSEPARPASAAKSGCDFQFPHKIADLRIVEQELKDYLAGEVAHVENILQGELKERSTRRLKRTETTLYSSTEREETNEKDTQTADRFSLEKEISKTVKKDTELELNGKVEAEYYGPVIVKATLEAGFTTSNSSEQSTREAVSYAKDVVQRAAQKVIERVKDEQTVKTTEEFEENNRHLLDNTGGAHHVVGVYRWLNKEYRVWLKNYGKRLMFELMIPEPAAYHLFAITQQKDDTGIELAEPLPPGDAASTTDLGIPGLVLHSHQDMTPLNYALWAAAYGADVAPPPSATVVIAGSVTLDYRDGQNTVSGPINIPAGYVASRGFVFVEQAGSPAWGNVQVGLTRSWGGQPTWALQLNNETGSLPVNVAGGQGFLIAHVDVECACTPELLEEWKIRTYRAIIGAYEAKKAAYDNAVAEARAHAGVVISGTNPLYNSSVIETELKKNAIRLMMHCTPPTSEAMVGNEGDFDCCAVMAEAPVIKFVEQVFEWRNMVYEFYPYHWAARSRWARLYSQSDTDPFFQNFMKAGYARVLVPVTPGFAQAALNFVHLGRPDLNDLAAMPVQDVIDGMDEDAPTLEPARVAIHGSIDLNAPGATLDGVVMAVGDRVLLAGQDAPAENGVYTWTGAATQMVRAPDATAAFDVNQAVIEVTAGSDAGFAFRQTEDVSAVGTDPISFKRAAEIINESLLIPTDLTILECRSAGVDPTSMKILGLCATAGMMAGGGAGGGTASGDDADAADDHEH